MDRFTGSTLESYLSEYGWVYRAVDASHWRSGFQGESSHFPLLIMLSDTWLSFHIDPLLQLHIDWESWPEIGRMILELNARYPMVKLSIDASGHIGLSLEIFTRSFDYESFCLTMGLLGFYADRLYDDILSGLDLYGFRYSETLKLLT